MNKVQGISNAKCINVWVAQSLLLCVLCFTKGLVSIPRKDFDVERLVRFPGRTSFETKIAM